LFAPVHGFGRAASHTDVSFVLFFPTPCPPIFRASGVGSNNPPSNMSRDLPSSLFRPFFLPCFCGFFFARRLFGFDFVIPKLPLVTGVFPVLTFARVVHNLPLLFSFRRMKEGSFAPQSSSPRRLESPPGKFFFWPPFPPPPNSLPLLAFVQWFFSCRPAVLR